MPGRLSKFLSGFNWYSAKESERCARNISELLQAYTKNDFPDRQLTHLKLKAVEKSDTTDAENPMTRRMPVLTIKTVPKNVPCKTVQSPTVQLKELCRLKS